MNDYQKYHSLELKFYFGVKMFNQFGNNNNIQYPLLPQQQWPQTNVSQPGSMRSQTSGIPSLFQTVIPPKPLLLPSLVANLTVEPLMKSLNTNKTFQNHVSKPACKARPKLNCPIERFDRDSKEVLIEKLAHLLPASDLNPTKNDELVSNEIEIHTTDYRHGVYSSQSSTSTLVINKIQKPPPIDIHSSNKTANVEMPPSLLSLNVCNDFLIDTKIFPIFNE